jgi:anaerobic ribonucleoside-triphosphate reductase activating protein
MSNEMLNVNRFWAGPHPVLGHATYVWTQGCPRRCHRCCNVEALDMHTIGLQMTPEELAQACLSEPRGLVLSGGEPFEQAAGLARVCELMRERVRQIPIIAYTGYVIEELFDLRHAVGLLRQIDLLIDGPFDASRLSASPLAGSSNQRLFFLSDRVTREQIAAAGRPQIVVGVEPSGVRLVGAGRTVPLMQRVTRVLGERPLDGGEPTSQPTTS